MKIVSTLVMVLLLGPLNNAKPQFVEWSLVDWRDTAHKTALCTQSNMEYQLLSGVWKQNVALGAGDPTLHQIMQFSPNGKASELTQRKDGRYHHQVLDWKLVEEEEQAVLLLSSFSMEQRYLIDASDDRIKLVTSGKADPIWMDADPIASDGALRIKIRELCGSWENMSAQVTVQTESGQTTQLEHALIRYELNPSGTYRRSLIHPREKNVLIAETGQWELSRDGNLLFFYPDKGGPATSAQIKWLERDELVLEQPLPFAADEEGTVQDLYFNKH